MTQITGSFLDSNSSWTKALLALMAFACCMAFSPSSLFAQNIQHTENKPDLGLRSDARVDPSTLGMSFSVPLASYPGRAGHGLPVAITYNSKVLRLAFDTLIQFPFPVRSPGRVSNSPSTRPQGGPAR